MPHLKPATTVDDLLAEMQWCGIEKALVRHAAMENEPPQVGNHLLLKETRDHPELVPTWAILPPATGELGTVEEFLEQLAHSNVRALWAFPSKHRYTLDKVCCGTLLRALVAYRIPLFIQRQETSRGLTGWELAGALLQDFPDLRLVVVGHGSWGEDRYFRPLIEAYSGLYLDTSRYELDGGIEDFCRKYGPERLLFGSAFPATSPGGAMLTLAHADIRDEARELIAAGNLERLLKEVEL
ncbi:MAG: amidohydrolase family protein [Candidatus Zipacnadales bacterium]